MAFRKPITTLGGLMFWENIRQNEYFILQKHKSGPPVWPYTYRITMRENRMEIANANDESEIEADWAYLERHAVPQIEQAVDLGKVGQSLVETAPDIAKIVLTVVSKLI